MEWLKRLLTRKPESKQEPGPAEPEREAIYFGMDDETFHRESNLIEGLEFCATLQLRTPLPVLERHGEVFNGPPSEAPVYGNQSEGTWVFKVKEEFSLFQSTAHTQASDIGTVAASYYLPFLRDFRSIVESNTPHDDQLEQLSELSKKSSQYEEIWQKLCANRDDFPASFFYTPFTLLPGIGNRMAKRLYEHGFRSIGEIQKASVDRLTTVPGLGKATVTKIKNQRPD